MKPSTLASCSDLITIHFQLEEVELQGQQHSEEQLTAALAHIINSLLNQDLPRLMNILYKIDLDEHIFNKIITEDAPDQIGLSLAKEVIKRELQKVKTRELYRRHSG